MRRSPASTNVGYRLRDGVSSPPVAASLFVEHVRCQVAKCKNSGSQQHRLRYGDENWLVSQHRWITELLAAGESDEAILRVIDACADEARAMLADRVPVCADFVEVAKEETATGCYEDMATYDAMAYPSPGTLNRVWELAHAQVEALRKKMRLARARALTLAAKQ